MGFLDKAKKLAEQAQTKLDEVQKQVNTSGGGTSSSGGADHGVRQARAPDPARAERDAAAR